MIWAQGELAHRALKALYPLTSKLDTQAQLAKHERRRRILRKVVETTDDSYPGQLTLLDSPAGFKDHHYIPKLSFNHPLDIFRFLRDHDDDPAVAVCDAFPIVHLAHDKMQGFIPKLKDFILYRLRNLDVTYCDHAFTNEERNSVIILNNRLYSVQTMQVCYQSHVFCLLS